MRALSLGWIRCSFLLVCCSALEGTAAADTPSARTLIEQAIAAQGGMKALETIKATIVTTKGKLNELGEATFRAETFTKYPNQYRLVMNAETAGLLVPYVDVLNGDHAWNRGDQGTEEVSGPRLTEMKLEAYVNYVSSLVPLLRDEGFSLSSEARQQVNNAAADVVLVKKKDKPDIHLFFDAQTHLTVKTEHKHFDPMSGKDAKFEAFVQDFRIVDPLAGDRKILADGKVGTDAAALRAFLRMQSLDANEQKQVRLLIKSFGDDKFAVREEAKAKVIKMGPRVRGLLEEATRSGDPEIASRARECMHPLEKGASPELLGAVVRMLSIEHDPDSLSALLGYLPFAGVEGVAKEVRAALAAHAGSDAKTRQKLTALSKTGEPSARKSIAALLDPASDASAYRVYPVGVKYPTKGMELRDGKKVWEWETTEVRFYHSLPSSLFAKP